MKKDFENFLNNKNCFKLILGANNQDLASISEIVEIYSQAGCKFFDINASKKAYLTAKSALKCEGYICLSVGVEDDIHFSKCKIDEKLCKKCGECKIVCIQNAILDYKIEEKKCIGCKKCSNICSNNAIINYKKSADFDEELFKIADCIEFHISSKNIDEIYKKWNYLAEKFDGYLSICLNRKYFSDEKIIEILDTMLKIRNKNVMIQADGNPMSGGCNDNLSSLQAIALADLILKNFKDIPVFLSGGTNSKTAKLVKTFDLDIAGISIGSYARKIIQNKTKEEQLAYAKELIESVQNV